MGASSTMRRTVLIALVAALAVSMVASSEETTADAAAANMHTMSRAELIDAFKASQQALNQHKVDLKKAQTKIANLQEELDAITDEDQYEDNRKSNEKAKKAAEKKKAAKKKKAKFSDVLMEHVAKFLAMKAAKNTQDKGSTVQKKAVLEAARTGGRAGAAKPLKKVARSTAVAAVKKARAAAKKAGTKGKHALRKISVKAAKDAVKKLMKDQDELVEAAAQKFLKEALKKYPPSVFLAEDDDKPNHFTAPPGIHLTMAGTATSTSEVHPIKEDAPKKKNKAAAVKKAAAAAKHDASTVVPEKTH